MRKERGRGLVAAAGALVLLGACAAVEPADEAEREFEAAQAGITCGADGLQDLVGTSVGALDSATLPETRRVIFPGMAVTMDFRPERLNIEVGSDDRIARVFCG